MNSAVAVTLLVELLKQAASISVLIRQAQAEGRDLTAVELNSVAEIDDAARASLVDAIAKAKGV
jgi:ABC-type transporter Mla MlaB component